MAAPRTFVARVVVVAALALGTFACGGPRASTRLGGGGASARETTPRPDLVREERNIDFVVAGPRGEQSVSLGALLVRPREGSGPTILVVPGGGDISRFGSRPGDGISRYARSIDVNLAWAEAFAARGARVLLWDKRTCGPNDDPRCKKNPQDDIDVDGPLALVHDVDAACELARAEWGFDGRLVLFAHGQAAQVALASSCARSAAALVLLAPIPRAIDEVIVAGLKDRAAGLEGQLRSAKGDGSRAALAEQLTQVKNLAGTREAEFASMKGGRFAPTARVGGATLGFWKGWMDLTARTAALVDAVSAPKIVVLGGLDRQYGQRDRVRIRALAPDAFLEVAAADHHLLTGGRLADGTVDAVGGAIDKALGTPGS